MRSDQQPGAHDSWPGRYSDGVTAATKSAAVTLRTDGLAIASGGTGATVWTYAELGTAFPITRNTGDILLTSTAHKDATLFVADRGFVVALATKAPQLTAGSERWRASKYWMVAAAVALILVAAGWALDLSPSRAVARMMPDTVRERLGTATIRSMTGRRKVCSEPAGRAALDRLTARLTEASGSGTKFKVTVVDWDLLNAFAVPGEHVILTRELIEKAESPDEVAGVLAHEIGHGLELHPETGLVHAIGLGAAVDLMMGGGGGTLSNMGVLLAQLNFSREAEREADTHALRMLKEARISSRGLGDFFTRIAIEEGETIGPDNKARGRLDILSTHPNLVDRAALVAKQGVYQSTSALSPGDWTALRGICPGEAIKK